MRKSISILTYLFICNNSNALLDGDTVVLMQMLGAELQATAGILEMVDKSSKALDQVRKAHFMVSDKFRQARQLEYLAGEIQNIPKRMNRIDSMQSLYGNMLKIRSMYRRGDSSMNSLLSNYKDKHLSDSMALGKLRVDSVSHERKMALDYYDAVKGSLGTAESKVYGSRTQAFNNLILVGLKEQMNENNMAQKIRFVSDEIEKEKNRHSEYAFKKNIGLIPNICYADYRNGSWDWPTLAEKKKNQGIDVCKSEYSHNTNGVGYDRI